MADSDFEESISRRIERVFQPPQLDLDMNKLFPANPHRPSEIFNQLMDWIKDFDSRVDNAHSTAVRLVNFGHTIQFFLVSITCCDSPMMLFKGRMQNGNPVELIQHISQLSVLLITQPRQNPEEPKTPIGFITEGAHKQ